MISHSPTPIKDYDLEVARGNIPYTSVINKFGFAPDCDNNTPTDIWSGSNSTDALYTWVAPTAARVHAIASDSLSDSAAGGVNAEGVGAHTIRLYGLPDWDTKEISEDVTLDGTTAVNTVNSYVIIHRMQVIETSTSATTPNVGQITAVAATDGTTTAIIEPDYGQTMMAIYGIPSTQSLYMKNYHLAILKGAASVGAEMLLKYANDPANNPSTFVIKEVTGLTSEGTSSFLNTYLPSKRFVGPGIIKVEADSSANNVRISANFGGFLLDN